MISLITALCMVGDSMMYIILPLYWQQFGLEALWQVGILLAVNRMIRLPFNPIALWLIERIGQRKCILMAIILAILTTSSYIVVSGFWIIFIVRCIWGIAWNFLRLGAYTSILYFAPINQRGYHMGIYNGISRLGSLVGMLGGALIAENFSPYLACGIFAALGGCALPIAYFYIPNTKFLQPLVSSNTESRVKRYNAAAKKILFTSFSSAFVYQGLFTSMISYLISYNHITLETLLAYGFGAAGLAGLIQSIRWVWEPFLAPMLGSFSDEQNRRRHMLISVCFIAALLFCAISYAMPLWLWLIMILFIQVTATAITTLGDAIATDVAIKQSDSHRFMSAHSFYIDLGSATAPVVGYLLNSYFGIHLPFILAGVLLFMISVLLIKLDTSEDKSLPA